MKNIILSLSALALISTSAFAQDVTAPAVVNMTVSAKMDSLIDVKNKDTFKVVLTDKQVETALNLTCQLGKKKLIMADQKRGCAVAGNGNIVNPSNGQKLPRAQYQGGFVTDPTGFAAGDTMAVTYLAIGKVVSASDTFKGGMKLKPELSSSGAQALVERVQKGLKGAADGGLINTSVDTVTLERFFVPSAGLPSDKGCIWNMDAVFAYQTFAWYIKADAVCEDKTGKHEYKLEGNMPWVDTVGKEGVEASYNLTLALPAANATGDDALFAEGGNDNEAFAAIDGISGNLVFQQGRKVKVMVDGKEIETAASVEVVGSLTGNKVPLPAVRSFGVILGLLSQALYGA